MKPVPTQFLLTNKIIDSVEEFPLNVYSHMPGQLTPHFYETNRFVYSGRNITLSLDDLCKYTRGRGEDREAIAHTER
jgi:hypothetical protein